MFECVGTDLKCSIVVLEKLNIMKCFDVHEWQRENAMAENGLQIERILPS